MKKAKYNSNANMHGTFLSKTKWSLCATIVFLVCYGSAKANLRIDLIDDVINTGATAGVTNTDERANYTGNGNNFDAIDYDIPNNAYIEGLDGSTDFTVQDSAIFVNGRTGAVTNMTATYNAGTDDYEYTAVNADGVNYGIDVDNNGTGLRSTILFTGTPTSNNLGHRVVHTLDVILSPSVVIQELFDFSVSSANTDGIGWEFSYIQLLDRNGNPFDTFDYTNINDHANHTSINGQPAGTVATLVGDDTGSVTNVGTNQAVSGTSGPENSLAELEDANITIPTAGNHPDTTDLAQIGGFRFVHVVEETRGTNNGNTSFSGTINDIYVEVAPEPSSAMLIVLGAGLLATRRRRRSS